MRRRSPRLGREQVAGWHLDQQPNSFASQSAWEISALDAEGYLVERRGFMSKRDAVAWAETHPAPTVRQPEGAVTMLHARDGIRKLL